MQILTIKAADLLYKAPPICEYSIEVRDLYSIGLTSLFLFIHRKTQHLGWVLQVPLPPALHNHQASDLNVHLFHKHVRCIDNFSEFASAGSGSACGCNECSGR